MRPWFLRSCCPGNNVKREAIPASELIRRCGAAGRTATRHSANPALGAASICWSATAARPCCRRRAASTAPSICARRASANRRKDRRAHQVGDHWPDRWRDEQQSLPGNKAGGLTTILEVAGRGGQGRYPTSSMSTNTPSRSPARASSIWTRRLRPGVGHRPGGRRRLCFDRPRRHVRQTHAVTAHEYLPLSAHD